MLDLKETRNFYLAALTKEVQRTMGTVVIALRARVSRFALCPANPSVLQASTASVQKRTRQNIVLLVCKGHFPIHHPCKTSKSEQSSVLLQLTAIEQPR